MIALRFYLTSYQKDTVLCTFVRPWLTTLSATHSPSITFRCFINSLLFLAIRTLIHEGIRFQEVLNSGDFACDEEDCKQLAADDFEIALMDVDNHIDFTGRV